MIIKEMHIENNFLCTVRISKDDVCVLYQTFNEVLNGIYNVDYESELGVSEDCAMDYYDSFKVYRRIEEPQIEVTLPREAFVILQRGILVVMDDFGCYPHDYSCRMNTTFDEYLSLLDRLNSILEESYNIMCREMVSM